MMVIPKLILAGAETMCENLSTALSEMGHDVIVVSLFTYESAISRRLAERGIRVIFLDKKMGYDPTIRRKLRELMEAERPDVVHTHLYVTKYAIPAAKSLRIPVVHTMHNIASEENQTRGGVFLNRFYFRSKLVRLAALSERIRDTIVQTYHKKPEDIAVIGNGIPLGRFAPKQVYKDGDALNILNIGRFTDQKNQLSLIRAMILVHKTHPQAALTIVGEGELEGELKAAIASADAGSYIRLAPVTDDPCPLYNAADIFALPSVYEGMPMTLAEAMACGLPILTTPVGGIPDMLVDEISAVFTETSPESIASGLNRLLDDKTLREYIGKNALLEAPSLSAARMAEGYLKLYQGR